MIVAGSDNQAGAASFAFLEGALGERFLRSRGAASAKACDVHLEDDRVVNQAVDSGDEQSVVWKTLFQSANGRLAVISMECRSATFG